MELAFFSNITVSGKSALSRELLKNNKKAPETFIPNSKYLLFQNWVKVFSLFLQSGVHTTFVTQVTTLSNSVATLMQLLRRTESYDQPR